MVTRHATDGPKLTGQDHNDLVDVLQGLGSTPGEYGPLVYGDTVTAAQATTNRATLTAWAQHVVDTGARGVLPAQTITVDGTVRFPGPAVVDGTPGKTVIRSTSTTDHVLVIGGGALTGSLVNGYVRGVTARGPAATPPRNGQVGILLDKVTQVALHQCTAENVDIGFDAVNNCYGWSMYDCRAGFYSTCNVGLNLRSTPDAGCGNQCFFWNCWLEGARAAVHISPDTDGLTFVGGQMVAGRALGTANTDLGVLTIGKDYLSGTEGAVGNVKLDSVDFEQAGALWLIRSFMESWLTVEDCPLLSNNDGGRQPIGVMRVSNGGNGSLIFRNDRVIGNFSGAVAFDVSEYGATFLHESGWKTDNARFGGVQPSVPALFVQSALGRGISQYRTPGGSHVTAVDGTPLRKTVQLTQAAYDALTTKDPDTLYLTPAT